MSSTAINSLINVRYYGPQDPYHYSTDNRPLTDLNTNIVSLAGLIDGLASGNVFYVVDTSGVVNSLEATTSLLAPTGPYTAGQLITIRVNNTNTGAVTFTANSGAAYSVNGMSGALQGGELVSGKHYLLSWEDSDAVWELVGSSKGNLQVAAAVRSSQAVNLGQLTDGGLSPTFNVVNAAAGTSGTELVNYTQMTDGSLAPRFSLIERTSSQESQNWLPNSTFLFGFAGWQAPPAGLNIYTYAETTYVGYVGTDPSLQYWRSNPIYAGWINPGTTCTLSGWIFNPTSSGDAYIVVSCFSASGGYLSTIASSSLSSGAGWTYVSTTGVFPAGTAYVQVAIGFQGASSGSNIAFSRLKFEFGATATLWDDAASAQLFQNGQFSPEFDNIQVNGFAQLNSNWTYGDGIIIGSNPGGAAGLSVNAPAGYSAWLERLTVDGAPMWHVDQLGNAVATGTVYASAANIAGDQTIGGTLAVTGTASAAAGTSGGEVVNLGQLFIGNRKAVFTSNGSYTVPAGVTQIWVSGVGGGGGGGGGNLISSTTEGAGGGGGFAGQVAIKRPIAVTPGAALTVTIGAGGAGGAGVTALANAANGVAGGTTTLTTGATTLLILSGGDAGSGAYVYYGSYVFGGVGFAAGMCLNAKGAGYTISGNIGYGGSGQGTPFGGGGGGANGSNGGGAGAGAGAGAGGGGASGPGGSGNSGILIVEW